VHRAVVEQIGEPGMLGYSHLYWGLKKQILKEKYDIDWQSPAELNPTMEID
jgi:hypothetical protein